MGYQNYEAFSIFRNFIINFNQWYGSTFGNEKLYFGGDIDFNTDFKNFWHIASGVTYDTKALSTSELRGGPSLLFTPNYTIFYNVTTNSRKNLIMSIGANHSINLENVYNFSHFFTEINWRVSKALKISVAPYVNFSRSDLAYVNNVDNPVLKNVRYIRGLLNQTETSFTLRINYNITPDFTIQYYGMPFVSAGDYSNYKFITNSKAAKYTDRFSAFNIFQIMPVIEDNKIRYWIDENIDGTKDYSFDNPDFNFFEYRSNLIARWEYSSGSVAYLVWSFSQNRSKDTGKYSFTDDMGEIFKLYPHSILLLKISYRFGL